ncbi:MAG: HNH endonuclease [Halorhabdus sp.]
MESSRDDTPTFGDIVEGTFTGFKSHGGGVVNINGGEYILQDDTDASIGDTISVRVLHGDEVITSRQLDEMETQKHGYPNEYYAQVYAHTSGNNRRVIGIENDIDGEDYFTARVTCPRGTPIPIMPVPASGSPSSVVVCTDPSFWSDDYATRMANLARPSTTQFKELREIFIAGDPIPTNEFDLGVPGHDIVIEGEIIRFSQNDNAIVAIHGDEYTLRGDTERRVGDKLTVKLSTPDFVERVSESPVLEPQRGNGAIGISGDNDTRTNRTGTPNITDGTDDSERQSEPSLTESTTTYTETRQRERDSTFTEDVRTAYDERCAVCGVRRVTPGQDPNSEVEAAHIYPKREGGVDDVRNGIALCKLHHWAFDNGWFSITDDYEIIVADAPERDGYEEFVNLAGELIRVPDDKGQRPHPKFPREHRGLHGFDSE